MTPHATSIADRGCVHRAYWPACVTRGSAGSVRRQFMDHSAAPSDKASFWREVPLKVASASRRASVIAARDRDVDRRLLKRPCSPRVLALLAHLPLDAASAALPASQPGQATPRPDGFRS